MKPILREIIVTLLMALVLFLGIHYALQNAEVISGSMLPTLSIGERLFINKLAYKFGHLLQRGDIIVFVPPPQVNSDKDYIKRIIGLPGEVVEITGGNVYIHKTDGTVIKLDEPYITAPADYTYTSPAIAPDNYFVMGDNRNNSGDSHTGWTVPRSNIVGRAWWVTWPFSKFGAAPNYKLSGA
ncbi:MAG: signal peptidase I [Dehalococcoidia bacterium]|nr:MAG: signal peptidase I [Dehalococcoidia bacterium]